MFVFLFCKIIDYIESLYDEQSPATKEANDLFMAIEENENTLLSNSIDTCTELSFDILRNILDEYIDDGWIHQTSMISNKISKQKEREKQNLINDLEGKTADERLVTVELQTIGVTNWFKDSSKDNLDAIKSSKYESQMEEDRMARIKETFYADETAQEVAESLGVNIDAIAQHQPIDNEIEDEGYSQRPIDREDEGLDDADEDGDYRDN